MTVMENGFQSMSTKRNGPSDARLERVVPGVKLITLSRETGISVSTLSRFERGKTTLSEAEERRRRAALRRLALR